MLSAQLSLLRQDSDEVRLLSLRVSLIKRFFLIYPRSLYHTCPFETNAIGDAQPAEAHSSDRFTVGQLGT